MDQSVQKRWVKLALLSACGGVGFAAGGCEKPHSQADRAIVQAIEESRQIAAAEGLASESVASVLEKAARQQDASGAAIAQARALAGQVHYAQAIAALPAVVTAENRAAQITREISRLAADISANNALVDAYRGTNPAGQGEDKPLEAVASAQKEFRTLIAALDQQIATLGTQVQAEAKKIANLDSQATKALHDAATLAEQSEQVKGEESVKLFKQSVALRNSATKLSQTAADAKVDLGRLQKQMEELQTQKQVAVAGIEALARQSAEMTQSWGERQKLIVACAASSKQIADPALGTKAKALLAAMEEADKLRTEAEEKFAQAIENYEAAAEAASKLTILVDNWLREYPDAPEHAAWKQLKQTQTLHGYRLIVARAYHARGSLHASHRSLLLTQQRLIEGMLPAFRQAGLAVPPGLDVASLNKRVQEVTKKAIADFGGSNDEPGADKVLADIVDRGDSPAIKDAARMARVAAQYALYRLTGGGRYLETARATLTELAPSGSGEDAPKVQRTFPSLPAELEEGIIKHELPSAPPTQPAEAPAAATPTAAAAPAAGGNDHPWETWMKMVNHGGKAVERAFDSKSNPAPGQ